ncbi:glycosyl transferase [Chelonobacter oris]|uniref:Glycosyl transferase n=1 Tax=Chelonobacter oris TaxID=505317 RepID=A0A0A3AUM5_9PAST|nr:glycosyltransferase family 25 protein [Chelonobacter oris]KGQ70775.1 glycosyl transferase [Chelonobacter oris]
MTIPIYVINLESSKDRAQSIARQFRQLDIDYHLFPAINGNQPHPLFKKYNAEKHFFIKGRTLSKGELGCFASHYLLWEKCVQHNNPIIILEDDAYLTKYFNAFYIQADEISTSYDFIWLHKSSRGGKHIQCGKVGQFSIEKYFKDYICATGYLISPKAAKKFLEAMDEWLYPVDDSMARFYENGVENLAISPACISDSNIASTIGEDNRGKQGKSLTLISKLRREYFNLKARFNRFMHNKQFIRKLKK